MTPAEAIAFVASHGIVLESARGAVPCLVQEIAGGEIHGNWWSHPLGKTLFRVTRAVRASEDILVCRLVAGKVTLVHRRLWPALARCAMDFPPARIARIVEEHTPSGKHQTREMPFPQWVPADVMAQSRDLDKAQARAILAIGESDA